MVLQNNGGDDLTICANGVFTFPLYVLVHNAYAATVAARRDGETCVVSNRSSVAPRYAVTGMTVRCVNTVPTMSNWEPLSRSACRRSADCSC